jgi:hypothetical protein
MQNNNRAPRVQRPGNFGPDATAGTRNKSDFALKIKHNNPFFKDFGGRGLNAFQQKIPADTRLQLRQHAVQIIRPFEI